MEASVLKIREVLRMVTAPYMTSLSAVEDDVNVSGVVAEESQELCQSIHNAELALSSLLSRAGQLINKYEPRS